MHGIRVVRGSLRLSFPTGVHYTSEKLYVQLFESRAASITAESPTARSSSSCGEDSWLVRERFE